jgi:beta-galactosidase
MRHHCLKLCVCLVVLPLVAAAAGRTTIPLDGEWQLAESVESAPMPAAFKHRVPVPGLANLAQPALLDIDKFDSREFIATSIREKKLPPEAAVRGAGVSRQARNYLWYRRTVSVPALRAVATLQINKAQFGSAVWVNGQAAGEYLGCFSAGYFDVSGLLKAGENEVVVRIGAHPNVLPEWAPAGTDFEKYKWTPGIYDSVNLHLADGPVVETVQVAPRIGTSEALVEAVVVNRTERAVTVTVEFAAAEWKGAAVGKKWVRVSLGPKERKAVRATVRIPRAKLWTPETPHLYTMEVTTPGDSLTARFGMREFRFDTATKRAYLNGKLYFLRGSNITLHRFFEDPECKDRPWDEKWVRRLLTELPKQMNWNSFRLCIGPVPKMWLDIADETGLLLQHEFFIWNGRGNFPPYSEQELVRQYSDWMRDSWNHPSIAIWDASNETDSALLRDVVVPRVRQLDLSNRPWENGYSTPTGVDDPVEDHPYLFSRLHSGGAFEMTELERMTGAKTTNAGHPSAHATIINEYGWLWLNRDGSPTLLTERVWDKVLPGADGEARLKEYAYLLAGLTEFWRAHRNFAGVLHFTWLTCSYPGVKTSDHWRDVGTLTLEPHFAEWMGEAFKPLGVYINYWQPKLKQGERRRYSVMMVNDEDKPVKGTLALTLDRDGQARASARVEFALPAHGAHTYEVALGAPTEVGEYVLKAAAVREGTAPTVSRRRVRIE